MTVRSPWRRAAPVTAALLFATSLLVGGGAGAEEETVRLLPRWKQGEKLRYELVKTRRKTVGTEPATEGSNRTPIDVEVLRAAEDSYTLAWTTRETTMTAQAGETEKLAKRFADLTKDLRIVLDLDARAVLTGVRNWQEVRDTVKKALDVICDEFAKSGVDAATIAKTRGQITPTFAGKTQVEQFCTRDLQPFLMAIGMEFEGGKPVEFDDKLPNPFAGEPFPSKGRFTLRGVDRELGVANVDFRQTIDPEAARRIMAKTLSDMEKRMGRSVPDGDALKSLTIEDSGEFCIDLASGWVRSLTHRRVTKTDTGSQEDVAAFTRKSHTPPAAAAGGFPDDENGEVLSRMAASGDDLTKPRDIDYFFVFPDKKSADAFAADVRRELTLEAESEEADGSWDSTVTKNMVPTHDAITKLEAALVRVATKHGGRAEGWGCPQVDKAK
jgi:hypothetical protein